MKSAQYYYDKSKFFDIMEVMSTHNEHKNLAKELLRDTKFNDFKHTITYYGSNYEAIKCYFLLNNLILAKR